VRSDDCTGVAIRRAGRPFPCPPTSHFHCPPALPVVVVALSPPGAELPLSFSPVCACLRRCGVVRRCGVASLRCCVAAFIFFAVKATPNAESSVWFRDIWGVRCTGEEPCLLRRECTQELLRRECTQELLRLWTLGCRWCAHLWGLGCSCDDPCLVRRECVW